MPPIRVMAIMESSSVTGPAKNLIAFARWAAQAGEGQPLAAISIVTYVRNDTRENPFIGAARVAGVPVEIIRERYPLDVSALRQLRTIYRRLQPDIIQSHNVKSHLFVRMLGLQREVPWIAFHHGYTATDLKDRIYNQVDRWSLRAAFRAIAVCEPFGKRLRALGVDPSRIRIQHNSVPVFLQPTALETEAVRRALALGESRVITAIGRLSHEKGHADLLRAIALLAPRNAAMNNYIFVIVGDGPERSSLEKQVRQYGIEPLVRFTGHQKNVQPYLAISDFLVLPSHSEGSPNVVLEAMAAGVPVAATAVGGVPEIVIPEETGLLVAPRDPAAMATAIERLIADHALRRRMGNAGRQRAIEVYSPEFYCRSIIALYRETLTAFPAGK